MAWIWDRKEKIPGGVRHWLRWNPDYCDICESKDNGDRNLKRCPECGESWTSNSARAMKHWTALVDGWVHLNNLWEWDHIMEWAGFYRLFRRCQELGVSVAWAPEGCVVVDPYLQQHGILPYQGTYGGQQRIVQVNEHWLFDIAVDCECQQVCIQEIDTSFVAPMQNPLGVPRAPANAGREEKGNCDRVLQHWIALVNDWVHLNKLWEWDDVVDCAQAYRMFRRCRSLGIASGWAQTS